eukprot:TRINITY_DN1000_c0_g1_i1.p1 TRINITY_DN1000_c0_g1~~TRINITY_DN1000_c0_g1_i1.p1  ORF type:complete len:326 (-),score=72.20 TRINITY_DN1000_c0_g1_i1:685-1662(-)
MCRDDLYKHYFWQDYPSFNSFLSFGVEQQVKMWKTVIPRGMKLVGTAAGTAAGAVGVAPSEAECRAAHSLDSSSSSFGKHENLKLVMDHESEFDSWEMCGEEELTQACYDVFGRKPRILEIDEEMYRGSQPVLSHDLMDDMDSVESIGNDADRLMDSMHNKKQPHGMDQMQALSDATMYLVSKPNIQKVVWDEIESDDYFRHRLELLFNGFKQPMLPPSAQRILENDLTLEEDQENSGEGPLKKVLKAVSGTLHKIGDSVCALGNAVGGLFHNLANKIRKQLNMEEQDENGDGMAVGIGAVTILATAIILVCIARRAGVPIPRRV